MTNSMKCTVWFDGADYALEIADNMSLVAILRAPAFSGDAARVAALGYFYRIIDAVVDYRLGTSGGSPHYMLDDLCTDDLMECLDQLNHMIADA